MESKEPGFFRCVDPVWCEAWMSHLLKQQRSIEDTMQMLWVSFFQMLPSLKLT